MKLKKYKSEQEVRLLFRFFYFNEKVSVICKLYIQIKAFSKVFPKSFSLYFLFLTWKVIIKGV